MTLTVELITEALALQAAAADWWALWRRCPAATPFQSPGWLLPWWHSFHPGALRVAAVRAGGRLVGLAPLYREDGVLGRRLLPIGISLSDYLDVLVDPDYPEAASALLEVYRVGDHDRIDWEELRPGAVALELEPEPGWTALTQAQSVCPVLSLGSGSADLSGFVPALRLRKLRMARRRAERRNARLELATPGTASRFLDDLFALHGERWRSRGEPGVLADERVRHFHASALPPLLEAGLIRLSALFFDEQVAGIYYGFAHGDRAYAYLGGFDPAYGFESPGAILLADAIEAAMLAGASEFHFLRGQEPYKYEWGAVDRQNSRRVMTRTDAVSAGAVR